jgi:hypothetical protein
LVLSQDLAVKENVNEDFIAYLNDLEAMIDIVIPHESGYEPAVILEALRTLRQSFESDCSRVLERKELLFGDELIAYGERCTNVFNAWEEEGGGPSVLALLAAAWDELGLEFDDAIARSAVISAVLAEVPNDLQYHGNEHYRKVLFHTIRMLAAQLKLEDNVLEKSDVALMLIAATIHDLGHEGGDNLRDGIYTPGYMEQRSIDMAMPYYEELDMPSEARDTLQTLIFCTDITFFAEDNSPCVRMRMIYDYFYNDSGNEKVLNFIIGKLRLFDENPKLALMAMLIHEADIGSSAGLSYEQSVKETIDIMEERGLQNAGPAVLLNFLHRQLEGSMKTETGKALFGSAMEVIMDQATQELEEGKQTYYE